ncbi:MAG: cytochrome C oxidase subunit IV family protein [Planctomycetes bacterium]|nr:cytochrome C oxidase subunit IV family protein [Planctomycetota bacterium]
MSDDHHPADGNHHPHVVPLKLLFGVIGALFFLTFLTVAASWVDMGGANVPVALLIATVKAVLVGAFFMHLRWDKPFNSVILALSIGLLILFLGIVTMDMHENLPEMNEAYSEEWMETRRKAIVEERLEEARTAFENKEITKAEYDERVKELSKPVLEVLYPHAGAHSTPADGHADIRADALQKAMLMVFRAPLPAVIPSPPGNPASPAKVALGKSLFFETRLSKGGKISCHSCHGLTTFGVDNQPTSPGHGGARGDRNSPTVLNAGLFGTQFWDGRAPSLEEQAKAPILNPVEMAMSDEAAVVAVLKGIPGYVESFKGAFPGEADPLTYDNLAKAIAAFERTLVTPSPFDAFLGGKLEALDTAQLDGFLAFQDAGCVTCHKGTLLGDGFEKLGKVIDFPGLKDKGREAATGNAGDRYQFKVPSLRNVTKTGPYLHDGSVKSLDEVITLMSKHQVGKEIDAAEIAKIKVFLESLTGSLDPATAAAPAPVK